MGQMAHCEELLLINIDLLKIAKDYCQFNFEQSPHISELLTLIEIVLNNQQEVITELDRANII